MGAAVAFAPTTAAARLAPRRSGFNGARVQVGRSGGARREPLRQSCGPSAALRRCYRSPPTAEDHSMVLKQPRLHHPLISMMQKHCAHAAYRPAGAARPRRSPHRAPAGRVGVSASRQDQAGVHLLGLRLHLPGGGGGWVRHCAGEVWAASDVSAVRCLSDSRVLQCLAPALPAEHMQHCQRASLASWTGLQGPFEKLPNSYRCPVCSAPKRRFKPCEHGRGASAGLPASGADLPVRRPPVLSLQHLHRSCIHQLAGPPPTPAPQMRAPRAATTASR